MTHDKKQRRSPSPLAMHLAMTSLSLLDKESAHDDMVSMIKGMQKYQLSDYRPEKTPVNEVWSHNGSRLLEVEDSASAQQKPICIFIPSLVNNHDIFDLCKNRSMACWFSKRGFQTFIFDWGKFDEKSKNIDVTTLIACKLKRAVEFLKSNNPDIPIHVMGYCMGGTLCVGLAHSAPHLLSSLTLLASPWNYHAGSQTLLNRIQFWAPSALMQSEKSGVLTSESLQMLFASLDPLLAQRKFSNFWNMDDDSGNAHLFIAVEDWLNSGGNIPEPIAKECIVDWYIKNKQYKNSWSVDGRAVSPENIKCPVFIVASRNDRLVDYGSSMALMDQLDKADSHDPECGHIGMIAGRHSIENVWRPIADWMHSKSV